MFFVTARVHHGIDDVDGTLFDSASNDYSLEEAAIVREQFITDLRDEGWEVTDDFRLIKAGEEDFITVHIHLATSTRKEAA